ncbi:MAG: D-glutamate deacylase, partial [Parvibaculales bacterium]
MQKQVLVVALSVLLAACQIGPSYDVAINHGRVIDPQTGLDAVRHLGIKDGKIIRISTKPLRGETVLNVEGLVVAPGFIDYHWHCPAQACYEI